MHREIPYDSGLNTFRLKYGDQYIGGSHPAQAYWSYNKPEPAELVLVDKAEDAIVFEQRNWGWGSNFIPEVRAGGCPREDQPFLR